MIWALKEEVENSLEETRKEAVLAQARAGTTTMNKHVMGDGKEREAEWCALWRESGLETWRPWGTTSCERSVLWPQTTAILHLFCPQGPCLQHRNVLMSVPPVTTKDYMNLLALGSCLRPCWCLSIELSLHNPSLDTTQWCQKWYGCRKRNVQYPKLIRHMKAMLIGKFIALSVFI